MDIAQIAAALAAARQTQTRLDQHPWEAAPDMAQACAIQDAVTRAMPSPVVGWKVGLTSQAAQQVVGVREPIAGPLFAEHLHPDGAVLSVKDTDLRIVEAEIGLRIGQTLPPRTDYGRADIVAAVDAVVPLFELVNKRLPGAVRDTVGWLVADGAINQAVVQGRPCRFTPDTDLRDETVQVTVNADPISTGVGRNAMGDPLQVLVWLAGHLGARGIALNAGDLVATGLVCDLLIGERGDMFEAQFAHLGSVRMTLG